MKENPLANLMVQEMIESYTQLFIETRASGGKKLKKVSSKLEQESKLVNKFPRLFRSTVRFRMTVSSAEFCEKIWVRNIEN